MPGGKQPTAKAGERKDTWEEEEEAGLGQQPVEMPAKGKRLKQKARVSEQRPPEGAREAVGENPEPCQDVRQKRKPNPEATDYADAKRLPGSGLIF